MPSLFFNVLKKFVTAIAMVENAVHNNPYAVSVRSLQKLCKLFAVPELRVNRKIVPHVVLMVGRRKKNRRQIQRVKARIFQIRNFLRNSVQIPARKRISVNFPVPCSVYIRVVLFKVPARESVHKNLIEHRAVRPFHSLRNVAHIDKWELKKRIIRKVEAVFLRKPVL